MPPLSVYITVDTEFSAGDAFDEPRTGQPVGDEMVYCEVDEKSEGLGFMLDVLSRHGLQATFFVEALHTVWFGDDPMGRIAGTLVDSGHDVQLHAHPFWLYFCDADWRDRVLRDPPNDRISGKSPEEVADLIRRGQATFARWGLPPPTAFRTGGLDVDENVYRGLAISGLRVASNIGMAIYEPADPALHLVGGSRRIHGVLELPILTYQVAGFRGSMSRKTLTITGCSWSEIRTLLWKARSSGYRQVVLLTHPFEFVKRGGGGGSCRVNRINQDRFRKLCEFIARHPEDFTTALMRDVRYEDHPVDSVKMLKVSFLQGAGRILVNHMNDRL